MSRWYRAYTGTVTDEKIAEAALVAGCSRSVAIAGWHCILESAANRNNCGSYDTTPRRIAAVLCEPLSQIEALLAAFEELGLIGDGAVQSWSHRQYESDSSTDRVKRYRDARKAKGLVAQWQAPKELRESIYKRDGYSCVYCSSPDDLTLDHKTPEMHGGDHSPENLQTACRACNAQKRDLTHEEYSARLAGNGHVTVMKRPQRTETKTYISSSNEDVSVAPTPEKPLTVDEVVEAWNQRMAPQGFPAVKRLTGTRLRHLKARLRENRIEDWQQAMSALERSAFCRGENDRGWRADFDFLLQPKSFTKLLEGAYDH